MPYFPNSENEDEIGPDDPIGWGQPEGLLAAPTFPEGTPEHAAYAAELHIELAKFAKGEEPYPYPSDAPAGATAVRIEVSGRPVVVLKSTTTDRWSLNGSIISWQALMNICGGNFTDISASYATARTPAETRTGTPDRVHAALDELAKLRAECHRLGVIYMTDRADRIAAILRGGS